MEWPLIWRWWFPWFWKKKYIFGTPNPTHPSNKKPRNVVVSIHQQAQSIIVKIQPLFSHITKKRTRGRIRESPERLQHFECEGAKRATINSEKSRGGPHPRARRWKMIGQLKEKEKNTLYVVVSTFHTCLFVLQIQFKNIQSLLSLFVCSPLTLSFFTTLLVQVSLFFSSEYEQTGAEIRCDGGAP